MSTSVSQELAYLGQLIHHGLSWRFTYATYNYPPNVNKTLAQNPHPSQHTHTFGFMFVSQEKRQRKAERGEDRQQVMRRRKRRRSRRENLLGWMEVRVTPALCCTHQSKDLTNWKAYYFQAGGRLCVCVGAKVPVASVSWCVCACWHVCVCVCTCVYVRQVPIKYALLSNTHGKPVSSPSVNIFFKSMT